MTNKAISKAVAASWADPDVAKARSKRYMAAIKIGKIIREFPSVPAALYSLGINKGHQAIRATARDSGFVELEVKGKKVILAALEKDV